MLPPEVTGTVQQIIIAVSSGDYTAALARVSKSRCSAADICRSVADYGGRFSAPPFADWDVISICDDGEIERWSIRAPLWSEQEGGRSDLELHLSAALTGGTASIELDDIRVA